MRCVVAGLLLGLLWTGIADADDYDPNARPRVPSIFDAPVQPTAPVVPPPVQPVPTAPYVVPPPPTTPYVVPTQPAAPYVVPTQPATPYGVPYVPSQPAPVQPRAYTAPYGSIPPPPPPPGAPGVMGPVVGAPMVSQPTPRVVAPIGTVQPPAITQPPAVTTALPAPVPVARSTSQLRLILEGLFSTREDPDDTVGVLANGAGDMTWSPVNFDWEFGGRGALVFGGRTDTRWEIEGAYYGGWSDRGQGNGLFATGAPAVTTGPHTADLAIESDLLAFGISWRPLLKCTRTSRLDAIVGLRVLLLDENASIGNIVPGPNPALAGGTASVSTENVVFALQAGIGYEDNLSSTFSWFIDVAPFIGFNSADASTSATNLFAAGAATNSRSDEAFAWGVNLDLGIRICLGGGFHLSAGYSLLFVEGVAEIESAMDFEDVTSGAPLADLNETGVLFNSFFAGVTLDL